MVAPNARDFGAILDASLMAAHRARHPEVIIVSGDLHRDVGGYPGPDHRMPICCRVMRDAMRPGDEIVDEPPKGTGATLAIRYKLPRKF
jgi:hypothetical protein